MRLSCGRHNLRVVTTKKPEKHPITVRGHDWTVLGFDVVWSSGFISSAAPLTHCPISIFFPSDGFSLADDTHIQLVCVCVNTLFSLSHKTVTLSLALWLYAVNDASSILNHFLGNVKLFADCNTSFRADTCSYGRLVSKSF